MSTTWQQANPEKWREYKAAYYEANRESIAATKKAWALKNKERLAGARRARAEVERDQRLARRDLRVPNELLRSAKRRAKRDGIEFSISLSDIVVPTHCPLLGIELRRGEGRISASSPSLDRRDNLLGYVPGNVWVVSYRANAAKGDLTADELIAMGMKLKASLEAGARDAYGANGSSQLSELRARFAASGESAEGGV